MSSVEPPPISTTRRLPCTADTSYHPYHPYPHITHIPHITQALVRGVLARKGIEPYQRRLRRRHALWRRAVGPGRPRIIIGAIARKIQLPYRLRLQVRPYLTPYLGPHLAPISTPI